MNFVSDIEAQSDHFMGGQAHMQQDEPHLAVQILTIIGFSVFAIVAVSLAFTAFWPAGFALGAMIAWTWSKSRTFGARGSPARESGERLREVAPYVAGMRPTGNASFDTYRAQMLERLERESRDFETFLGRLREARDATEFDQFLDDRARAAREVRNMDDETREPLGS